MPEQKEIVVEKQTTLSKAAPTGFTWPPPQRPRPRQGPATVTKILLIVLATLLIGCGLGFIIYAATNQYGTALGTQQSVNISTTAQSQAREVRSLQETAQPLATAQAQIIASATAQGQPTMTAQAIGAHATATAAGFGNLLTQDTSGKTSLNDPLSDNSQNHRWDEGYNDNHKTGCNFVTSDYQVQEASQGFLQTCFADATNFRNFAYQASMTFEARGQGGILFRGNKAKGSYYFFNIDTDGNYALELYNGSTYTSLTSGSNTAIITGIKLSNDLTVIANDTLLSLYVNQTYITSVSDTTLSGGQIGMAVINTSAPITVDFRNAEVWKLSA